MKIQQISLKERLQRIDSGYASDPAFNESAIKAFANIPISVYLNGYSTELNLLSQLLESQKAKSGNLPIEKWQLWFISFVCLKGET